MLQIGNYDVLELSIPQKGMNQNVSAYQLPLDYAYVLENILSKPLGEGTVRFGTKRLHNPLSPALDPDSRVMGSFGFVSANGTEQLILYVQEFQQDHTADPLDFHIEGDFVFSFPTENAARYEQDTPIKIDYQVNGINTVYDVIADKTINAGGEVVLTVRQNNFPRPFENIQFRSVSFSTGTLYAYDTRTKTLSAPLRQNLSVACVPRSVVFLGKMLLCNGVDRVMTWDGRRLEDLSNFVKENATQLTRIDDRTFSFVCTDNFDISHYGAGSTVQFSTNGMTNKRIVANAIRAVNTVTVTVTTNLHQFVQNQTQLFYQDWVPRFSFLSVAHNRIWALGEGAVGLALKAPDQALRVYYPYKSNSLTDWFNEQTKTVPSLDLTEQHGVPDTLEAITHLGEYMIFAGRVKTQVWTGTDPLQARFDNGDGSQSTLRYHTMLPTGIVHGDLILELPNDVFFITKTGLQSFSTLNIAKQFVANSYDAVDPLIRDFLTQALTSNDTYRSCRSFKYDSGPLVGFKIGSNPVLVSLFSTSLYSWSVFSGDFERATSFCSLNGTFYLSCQNALFKYGDGNDGDTKSYGDQGGKALIPFSWSLPILHLKGKRFFGLRYDLTVDISSSFVLQEENEMSILISGDLPASYRFESLCRFDMRGDALKTIPLTVVPDDLVTDKSLGLRLDKRVFVFQDRLKFLASQFWVTLKGYTKDGPVSLKQLKLYGTIERNG